jgi:hypothetical protein
MRSLSKGLPRQPRKDGHFAAMVRSYLSIAAVGSEWFRKQHRSGIKRSECSRAKPHRAGGGASHGADAMTSQTFVLLGGALTFGVPVALAVRELLALRAPVRGEHEPPPEQPFAPAPKPLPTVCCPLHLLPVNRSEPRFSKLLDPISGSRTGYRLGLCPHIATGPGPCDNMV